MHRRLAQRGQGKLGCALWLLVLAVFLLICWKALPVKIHSAQLHDYMEEQAQFAGRSSAQEIRKRILKRAEELELPLTAKNLKVERESGRVRMECTYTVPLEFPFYTYNWVFAHKVDRPVFIV